MSNQRKMTKAERRLDNQRTRLGGLPIYWEHINRRDAAMATRLYERAIVRRGQSQGKSTDSLRRNIVEAFGSVTPVLSGVGITVTDNPPMVIEPVAIEDIGQGVTIHTPNMVCLDPNCNLPHGLDALTFQQAIPADAFVGFTGDQILDAYNNGVIEERGFGFGNPDCDAQGFIGVDPAKPGSDMTGLVFIDEMGPMPDLTTDEKLKALGLLSLPGVSVVRSGLRISDLAKLSGTDLTQAIEDL